MHKSTSRNVNNSGASEGPVLCSLVTALASGLLFAGCDSTRHENVVAEAEVVATDALETDVVWAINVGGPAYTGIDGTEYDSEESVSGGEIGTMETVKGSQDATLYKSYREGDIRIAHAIGNGTYDITFHFAEPKSYERGDRVFDAFAEDEQVIDDLDVMLFRDGKIESALTVTAPNVVVDDGELNIRFEASVDQPTLSALVVRNKNRPTSSWELVWSDEFDSATLDDAKWSPNIWPPRKVNDEDQAYTAREENLRVEDGKLIIEAHKEDYEGANYTSGRVHSDGKGDFLYGRFEVRAKLPAGKGTWPAIWMLPSDPFRY
ncbi:MAG: family 16 glycosylhydrolase, partial [Woeseiaceae bacterium]|nr:family 16 glycosylhydrolase [Woeseiaceae bacterium]